MSVALGRKWLKRSVRSIILLLVISSLSLLLVWTEEPVLEPHQGIEDLRTQVTQLMYYDKLPINDTEMERNAAIFLCNYTKTCQEKTARAAPSDKDVLCSCVPPGLGGSFVPDTAVKPWSTLADHHRELSMGGRWRPDACTARQRVAVVIPFRDRDEHLRILLQNLHPVLQRQHLEYQVFVVEQMFPHIFNKAALMNIGFHEAKKLIAFDCIVFHDVDMLPADNRQPYTCFQSPVHLGAYVDKYHYGEHYVPMFGGVTGFTKPHFEDVNGFSNSFYGWGGEDDDMRLRIASARLVIHRHPVEVSRYRMLQHRRDSSNPINPFRKMAHRYRPSVYARNGVNSIKYKTHAYEEKPLYTWLLVEPVSHVSNYTLRAGTCKQATMATLRIPIHKCAEACDVQTLCAAFVFDNDLWCFLKRWNCPNVLPSLSQRLYIKKKRKEQHSEPLSMFRRRLGDCVGGDFGGVDGIGDAAACARTCSDIFGCIGFVFAPTLVTKCYPKMTSCAETLPKNGVTMYDRYNETERHTDDFTGYRPRQGYCVGGDIDSVRRVDTEAACARICDNVPRCVGFVFMTSRATKCYLKMSSCAETLPRDGATMYDRNNESRQDTDVLPEYRRRRGDCGGGDVGGVSRVGTVAACAHICENIAECVGFVFVTSHVTKCYPKIASCAETVPSKETTMYDNINNNVGDLSRGSGVADDVAFRYSSRNGDCPGDDIKGLEEVTISQCATMCDHTPKCVAFSYTVLQSDHCWLKNVSCKVTVSKLGVIMFDLL